MNNNKNVIFISGWASESSIWDNLVSKIDSPHNCICIPWYKLINSDDIVKDMNIDHNQEYMIAGWSLGGMLAIQACIANEKLFSELILISSTARMIEDTGYEGTPAKAIKAMRLKLKKDRFALLNDFAANCVTDNKELFAGFLQESTKSITTEQLIDGLEYLEKTDLRNNLQKISLPTLIIHAENDNIIHYNNAVYLNNNIGNSTLATLKIGGHALPFSASDKLAELFL